MTFRIHLGRLTFNRDGQRVAPDQYFRNEEDIALFTAQLAAFVGPFGYPVLGLEDFTTLTDYYDHLGTHMSMWAPARAFRLRSPEFRLRCDGTVIALDTPPGFRGRIQRSPDDYDVDRAATTLEQRAVRNSMRSDLKSVRSAQRMDRSFASRPAQPQGTFAIGQGSREAEAAFRKEHPFVPMPEGSEVTALDLANAGRSDLIADLVSRHRTETVASIRADYIRQGVQLTKRPEIDRPEEIDLEDIDAVDNARRHIADFADYAAHRPPSEVRHAKRVPDTWHPSRCSVCHRRSPLRCRRATTPPAVKPKRWPSDPRGLDRSKLKLATITEGPLAGLQKFVPVHIETETPARAAAYYAFRHGRYAVKFPEGCLIAKRLGVTNPPALVRPAKASTVRLRKYRKR